MRFKLYFKLEKEEIPIQYRKTIISYFKHSLEEYNQKYYQKYYNGKDPIIKQYAFSAYYKQQKIEKDKIILEDQRLEINITTSDYETGIILYNSFNKQKHKKYSLNNNSMTLENITMAGGMVSISMDLVDWNNRGKLHYEKDNKSVFIKHIFSIFAIYNNVLWRF